MKTEKEIREHRDYSLEVTPGCGCMDCLMNRIAAEVLSWVLGEREAAQPAIDAFNEEAAKRRLLRKGAAK